MAVIGNTASTTSTTSATTVSTAASQTLGKYDFLKILATELTHQDPSNPMDNTEFIAQMAQFSTLEQMQNMSDSFDALDESLQGIMEQQTAMNQSLLITQSAALIGKNVTAEVDGGEIEGRVDSISIVDSVPYAMIGEESVPVSSITNIYEEEAQIEVPGVI